MNIFHLIEVGSRLKATSKESGIVSLKSIDCFGNLRITTKDTENLCVAISTNNEMKTIIMISIKKLICNSKKKFLV